MTQVEECAGDGVCKPPTRFQYSRGKVGFKRVATAIARPTSRLASPMLMDLDRDGRDELVVTGIHSFGDGSKEIAGTYWAVNRKSSGSWELHDTKLRVVPPEGRVLFLDVNHDGLPDAVESGFGDHALRTYFNTGRRTFVAAPGSACSLGGPGLGDQDNYFRLAAVIDANADGRQDILMPVPPGTLPGGSEVLPAWAILEATSENPEATFRPVEAGIPFEVIVAETLTPADPRGPRVGDLNGDGAQDVILPIGGVFTVFENLAVDQDLLVAVADRMNSHDLTDAGFVPNVSVSYGHLTDTSMAEGAPAREQALYLARDDEANGLEHDGLGRPTSRVDEHGAEFRTTTWTWDTAEHGIGQLHQLTSPEATKTYGYSPRGLLETTTLEIDGEREPLVATLGHDDFGRVENISYPAPAGAAPFVVDQERDAYGHVLAVRDPATQLAYWRLTDVDDAGHFRTEQFGNDVLTERSYYDDKQRLERFVTRGAMGRVQDLSYAWDDRLDLARHTDALQPNHRTERFRHDPLHRLTCAYFSPVESASIPCASGYGYVRSPTSRAPSSSGAATTPSESGETPPGASPCRRRSRAARPGASPVTRGGGSLRRQLPIRMNHASGAMLVPG